MDNRFTDEFRTRLSGTQCLYCGQRATTDEHFPPATYSRTGVIVPACSECNGFAYTCYATDFEERVKYIQNKIRKRYYNDLIINWADDELEELDYGLSIKVREYTRQQKITHERLAWNAAIYLNRIDPDDCFVRASKEMCIILRDGKVILPLNRNELTPEKVGIVRGWSVCRDCGKRVSKNKRRCFECLRDYLRSGRPRSHKGKSWIISPTTGKREWIANHLLTTTTS